MRNVKNVLGSGCFFLCLGGWVYSGQLIADDQATQARDAVLNAAAAAAAAAVPGATATPEAAPAAADAAPAGNALVQADTPKPAETPASRPATTEPTTLTVPVVNVGVDGVVEHFSAVDLDINTALNLISQNTKRNIIASKDVKGTVSVNLYNVTFTQMLDAILTPNGLAYREKGNFIYVYTAKELADLEKAQRRTINGVYHLHYVTALDASVLVKPLLSSTAIISVTPVSGGGLPTGITETGKNDYATDDTLVINDFPENQAEVEKALKQIDVRPKQVLIESTILDATLHENNALGVDLVSLSGLDFPNLTSMIGSLAGNSSSSSSGGSGSTTGVLTPGATAGNVIANGSTQANLGTDFASQVPQGGLSIGFLSNHISFFIRALETVSDVTVVANPKILALNKQHGEVHIGQKLGYLTTTTTQTSTQQTVQFVDIGTKLIFRPFIGEDGYVRMEIHPEQASGSIDTKGVPQTNNTEVTSNVMIKDGRTIVIGGLFSETTNASRGQVPVLGNIPVLGAAFRQTSDDTQRRETIVLLTPHIINDDTSFYEESEKKAQDVNRMMLGNRAGLQPWGRDRIAQLWYGKALEQLDAGNKDKALMYVDWALNTNPRFIEAIKLREKLTNKMVQEADESSINSFVHDVLRDDAATTPDSGGSGHYPPPAPASQPAR